MVVFLNRQKIKVKRIILVSILLCLIFLSSSPNFNNIKPINRDDGLNTFSYDKNIENPETSILNLTEYISGNGVNQTVQLYMNNESQSFDNENGYFEVPAPADDLNISSGDFKFNFNNNYTTDYVIENDEAINPRINNGFFEKFRYNYQTTSYGKIYNGTEYPANGLNNLIKNNKNPSINITSENNGIINFTILADFTNANRLVGGHDPNLNFKREYIMGFILNFTFDISQDANLQIYMWNSFDESGGDWINVTNPLNYKKANNTHELDTKIINKNRLFINSTNFAIFKFVFESESKTKFNLTLYDSDDGIKELDIVAFVVLEIPITNQKQVALEFDLKGENSTINGVYMWIRTLNLTLARDAELNISLYEANGTISRTLTNLRGVPLKIKPNIANGLIDSKIWKYEDFHEDSLFYFNFDTSKTFNLTRYNYFIVIKSNVSTEGIYSLVTIPTNQFGDGTNAKEHLLEASQDAGNSWTRAYSTITTDAATYYLDASAFKLNIERGYMPSDFKVNGIETLKIQNHLITNYEKIIEAEAPVLTWGLGLWNYQFNPSFGSESGKFLIELTWNNTYIKGFKFDVNYTVEIFRTDNCTTYYKVNYNQPQIWSYNYSLNLNDPILNNWNFTKFCYLYDNSFAAKNLYIPGGTNYINETIEVELTGDFAGFKRLCVNTSIIENPLDYGKYNGIYSLNLTSPNVIYDEHSYFNFKGILWETQGFMYGDNITASLDIQFKGKAPVNGEANVTLYYPNGTAVPTAFKTSSSGNINDDGTMLSYDFNNETILEVTKDIKLDKEFGNNKYYSLRFFWTNGSIIGCTRLELYIDIFDLDLYRVTYDEENGYNSLEGEVNSTAYKKNFNYLIGSINETTGLYNPNFYAINNSLSQIEGTFSCQYENQNPSLYMKSFLQNESIINPGEEIKIKTIIQNPSEIFDINVYISVKIVSLANENWIINESQSSSQLLKSKASSYNDYTKEFEIMLQIPHLNPDGTWFGKNAPIRQAGTKTIVTFYINNIFAGNYICNNNSFIVSEEDSNFEGYVIGSRIYKHVSSPTIWSIFQRDECAYLPLNTTFMVNIYDKYYVSSYNLHKKEFSLKKASIFIENITDPENLLKGQSFTLSAALKTEFGGSLKDKMVYCQYDSYGVWTNISDSPKFTDSTGSISFEINPLVLHINDALKIRLVWDGDNITLSRTQNIPLDIFVQSNKIDLSSGNDKDIIYRDSEKIIEVSIRNSGNSIIKINLIDVVIEEDDDIDFEIIGAENIFLNWLFPGDEIKIKIKIVIEDTTHSTIEINVIVKATNILSKEIVNVEKMFELSITNKLMGDLLLDYFMVIILSIIALLFISSYFYAKKINKKVEALAKEEVEKRPRKGRYVKVSELTPTELEKEEIQKESKEISEQDLAKEETKEKLISKKIIDEELDKPLAESFEDVETIDLEKQIQKESALEEEEEFQPSTKIEKTISKEIKKSKKKETKPKKKVLSTSELVKRRKELKRSKSRKKTRKLPKKVKQPKKKIKKGKKSIEPKQVEKKKTTDLDDLLKEKGFDD